MQKIGIMGDWNTALDRERAPMHVVFFHGYMGSGPRMFQRPLEDVPQETVGRILQSRAPGVKFHFPNAPYHAEKTPEGGDCQRWFDVSEAFDNVATGQDPAPFKTKLFTDRAKETARELNAYLIDPLLEREGIREENLILVGWSQGAVTALATGLQRRRKVAGIFCLSGFGLTDVGHWNSKPPLFFGAGERETHPNCNHAHSQRAAAFFRNSGFDVGCESFPDIGHYFSLQKLAWVGDQIAELERRHAHPGPAAFYAAGGGIFKADGMPGV